MNINKRKRMIRLGLFDNKPTVVTEPEVKVAVEEAKPLPVALKELPEEPKFEEVLPVEEVKEELVVVSDKKKSTKAKKVVEEDKPSDV